MNRTERIHALLELERIRMDKYNQTRELEFRINLALWTLIVLIGYYYKSTLRIDTVGDLVFFVIVLLVIVPGHYFFWLVPISDSEARDYARVLEFQNEVEKIIGKTDKVPERDLDMIKRDYRRGNLFLAGITALLLVLLGVFFSI
jgi:hypothetical protein